MTNMKVRFHYTGIRVKKLDESIAFYTAVLGMKLVRRIPIKPTQGEIADLVSEEGGPILELNYYPKGSKFYEDYSSGEELDHLAFKVDNLDGFIRETEELGYPVELEVRTDTEKWAYLKDPNGIFIELTE
jgi:lactoylglutathione lyase